jgi:hypothetical protein
LTKSGEPSLVTFSTNWTMAFFAAVSFHEASGSPADAMPALKPIANPITMSCRTGSS